MRRPIGALAATAIVATAIAGCGGGSAGGYRDIEDQIGFTRSGIVERQSKVEGMIRDCMKAQGFDYIPVDVLARNAVLTGKSQMSDEEFIRHLGYGISTLFGRGNARSDPNDKARKSLTAADRVVYDRALWGDSPGATFAEAVDSGRFDELGGCTKQATDSVLGGALVLATLQRQLDELDQRIAQDPRMVQAMARWSSCMAGAGYRYAQGDEIDGDLLKRFQAIVGIGVSAGATVPPSPGTSYDRVALAALQREEVKVANTDQTCEKHDVAPVESVVRPQYEKTFRQQQHDLLARVHP